MAMALLPTLQQLPELYDSSDSSLSFSSSFSFSLGRWYWLWLDDEGFSTNNNTWMLAFWLWMAYLTGHVCSISHIVHFVICTIQTTKNVATSMTMSTTTKTTLDNNNNGDQQQQRKHKKLKPILKYNNNMEKEDRGNDNNNNNNKDMMEGKDKQRLYGRFLVRRRQGRKETNESEPLVRDRRHHHQPVVRWIQTKSQAAFRTTVGAGFSKQDKQKMTRKNKKKMKQHYPSKHRQPPKSSLSTMSTTGESSCGGGGEEEENKDMQEMEEDPQVHDDEEEVVSS